ncbi:hypothetical protein K439DRAFT_1290809, partial [Ramaria rubella]
ALQAQFKRTVHVSDLDEAVSLYRGVLALRPVPHRERFAALINLAVALHTRFRKTDQRLDIDEAVFLRREALVSQPAYAERISALRHLAVALVIRFRSTDQPCDLDEAVALNQEALSLTSESHPDRMSLLDNLATTV